mgnify:FL=1|jgi:L-aminopeptidase/D-esterase-like protein
MEDFLKLVNRISLCGFLMLLPLASLSQEATKPDSVRTVSEMTIQELKEVVQDIVEDSIEQCVVAGTMEGRAVPLSLKVEGEVVAKMTCNFDKED